MAGDCLSEMAPMVAVALGVVVVLEVSLAGSSTAGAGEAWGRGWSWEGLGARGWCLGSEGVASDGEGLAGFD